MNSITFRIILGILTVLALATIWNVIYHQVKRNYITETAYVTVVEDAVSFKGVYLRDEEVLYYSGGGVVSYAVPDGGKLAKDSVIAEIYGDDTQAVVRQEIEDISRQLDTLKKISNPGASEVAQPSFFRNIITQKYSGAIYAREQNDIDGVTGSKEELLTLIGSMQVAMQAEGYEETIRQKIGEFEQRKMSLEAMLVPPIGAVFAEKSCYFVSYIDGYETALPKAAVDVLTVDYINSVSDDGIYTAGGLNVLGKIINGYEWYIAGVFDNSKLAYAPGDKVTVKFESVQNGVAASVIRVIPTENPAASIMVLSCKNLVSELVQHRTETVKVVKNEHQGIRVSRRAIRFRDLEEKVIDEITGEETLATTNYKGVYIKLGEQLLFKKLDVIYEADDYVITRLNMGGDYVSLYDDVIVEGIDFD